MSSINPVAGTLSDLYDSAYPPTEDEEKSPLSGESDEEGDGMDMDVDAVFGRRCDPAPPRGCCGGPMLPLPPPPTPTAPPTFRRPLPPPCMEDEVIPKWVYGGALD